MQSTFCQMTLNQFLLSVKLGWPVDERIKPQIISIDITLKFNTPPLACISDELGDTHCYHGLTEALKKGIENKSFRLLECLTKELYNLTKKYLANDIKVQVKATKKPSIENLIDGVSFTFGDKM